MPKTWIGKGGEEYRGSDGNTALKETWIMLLKLLLDNKSKLSMNWRRLTEKTIREKRGMKSRGKKMTETVAMPDLTTDDRETIY